ncbi:MgtC/SapB family protein [Candidatus Omnitrophota bacterium]
MLGTGEIVGRIFFALLFGGFIGLEREMKKSRGAGLRTHILVCIGSTLIMLTSLYVFDIYKDIANFDPGRLAAAVITGVGFLCAGTIIRQGDSVAGLTTAASLWISAAIGLAIGCGFYQGACIATALVLLTLLVLRRFETKLERARKGGQ